MNERRTINQTIKTKKQGEETKNTQAFGVSGVAVRGGVKSSVFVLLLQIVWKTHWVQRVVVLSCVVSCEGCALSCERCAVKICCDCCVVGCGCFVVSCRLS